MADDEEFGLTLSQIVHGVAPSGSIAYAQLSEEAPVGGKHGKVRICFFGMHLFMLFIHKN